MLKILLVLRKANFVGRMVSEKGIFLDFIFGFGRSGSNLHMLKRDENIDMMSAIFESRVYQ